MAATRVIHLGEVISGAGGALMVVDVDPVKHPDGSGGAKRTFTKAEEVFLLLHHGPEVAVVRVLDTAGGDLLKIGPVTRSNTVRLSWTHGDELQELPHLPMTAPVAMWFGRSGVISRDGRALRVTGSPAMADICYDYQAIQYRYRLPVSVILGPDGQFPVELIIETEE